GLLLLAGPSRVSGDLATNNAACGFELAPGGEGFFTNPSNSLGDGPVLATGDTSIANGCGFHVESYSAGAAVQLSDATATGNKGFGVLIIGSVPHVVTGSRISGNGGGVSVEGGPFQFTHNLVVANRDYAFSFFDRSELFPAQPNTLTLNDIVGNDVGLRDDITSVRLNGNRDT